MANVPTKTANVPKWQSAEKKDMREQMSDLVTCDIDGDIAIIGFNRPEKRNAISDKVIEALAKAVEKATNEAGAAVIYGRGKHFCSGLDLAEHVERTLAESMQNSRTWHAVFDSIARGTIPFFSALHGATVGGGLELAAATHVRVAEKTAFFALPEGQRGIFVGGGGSVRIAKLITVANMTDMMLTGRVMTADDAYRINLFQYLVEDGQALEKAKELARGAAKNAPLSNYSVINALPRIQDMAEGEGLFLETLMSSITTASPEAHERLRAFLDKKVAKIAPDSADTSP